MWRILSLPFLFLLTASAPPAVNVVAKAADNTSPFFAWMITPATIGVWGLIAGIVIWWIRGEPDRRRARTEQDSSLRTDLLSRLKMLEHEVKLLTAKSEADREHHEAEMRIMRHKLGNETTSLDALLMLLETNPDKVGDAVFRIKEMRKRQADIVAEQYAQVMAARVASVGQLTELRQDAGEVER